MHKYLISLLIILLCFSSITYSQDFEAPEAPEKIASWLDFAAYQIDNYKEFALVEFYYSVLRHNLTFEDFDSTYEASIEVWLEIFNDDGAVVDTLGKVIATRINDPTQLVIDFREGVEESREDREIRSLLDSALSREGEQPSGEEIQTIVIDPGHGGRMEPGAQGRYGTLEKDITLALALKLKAVIEKNRPVRVELTRDTDVSVSLENRAAIANTYKADLFISIHVNSSYRKDARGSETFFLGTEATDDETRRLAYLENNPAEVERGIGGDNQDEISMILWDMAQSAYLKESSLLAETIQEELNHLLGTRNRGIKQIPFKVLTGVACPAVLVEVAFISNPDEEKKLRTEWFQNNVVEAIYRGVESYIDRYTRR